MNGVIDLGSELLLDQSALSDPYVRLLAAALGEALAEGSPWVAIDRRSAALRGLARRHAAAIERQSSLGRRRIPPAPFSTPVKVRPAQPRQSRQPAGQEPGWPARLQTTSRKS